MFNNVYNCEVIVTVQFQKVSSHQKIAPDPFHSLTIVQFQEMNNIPFDTYFTFGGVSCKWISYTLLRVWKEKTNYLFPP